MNNDNVPATKQLRILSVCETIKGGVGTYIRFIDDENDGRFVHKIVALDIYRDQLNKDSDIVVYRGQSRGIRRMYNLFKVTGKTIKEWYPHIVFFHSTFTLPIMAWLKYKDSPPGMIYCAHGWWALSFEHATAKRNAAETIEGYLCGFADFTINISQAEIEHAESQYYRGRHVVIENAVSAPRLPHRYARDRNTDASDELNILFVGRFDRQKGLDILLEAFENVMQETL